MTDTTYMSQSEIDALNEIHGEKCEGCSDNFGPASLYKYRGYKLCSECLDRWMGFDKEQEDEDNATIHLFV